MKNHFDIIIVGCGLVGGTLALSLPQELTVAVIDGHSPMHLQPGFLALNRLSCHILKLFGVWDDIIAYSKDSTTSIKQIAISEQGNSATDSLILHAEDMGATTLGHVTSTTAIRETLLPRLQSKKNITLFCPQRAENIHWPDEGMEHVTVKLAEDNKELHAKLLIVADGGRSTLREQSGFEIQENNTEHQIVITQVRANQPHQNHAFERFTSEGPIALLPIHQEDYVLVWTMKASHVSNFLEQSERALFTALDEAYGNKSFEHWKEIGIRKTYPIIQSHVKNPIKTRLVLMGNAARTVHPVGAQGFNLSLKDAWTLNTLIRKALEQKRDIGSESLLKKYVETRKEDTHFVLSFTQSLLNIFSWNFPLLTEARNRIMSWINQSAYIKQAILEKTAGLPSIGIKKGEYYSPLQDSLARENDIRPKNYDILILGNRLVGSSLACALNSRYRIAILDKASTPTPSIISDKQFQLRINAYNRASEELLRAIRVWETLPQERLFAFNKVFATCENNDLSFCSESIGEPHLGHFIENDRVTYALHQRIKQLPNIEFIDNINVEAIQKNEDSIQIITQDQQIFSAKLLAACDGAHSITRQLLGLSLSHHPYYQRCIVANIFFEGDLDKTAWQNFLPTGPIGLLPLRHGVCSLAWSCDNDEAQRLLALTDDLFITELNHATLGRLGKILSVSERQSFPLSAQHMEHYYAERTLFLGDAAHTIHPLGGLGANLGFQDVIAAVTLLNDSRISSRDIGRRYLLEKYEKMRRRHNARVMDIMTAFNAMFHKTHPSLHSLGCLSLNIANKVTPIRNRLFREAMWMGTTQENLENIIRYSSSP